MSIVTIPNSILKQKARSVRKIDSKIQKVIAQMKDDLLNTFDPKGVGLAGPQSGFDLQIFITKPTDGDSIRVFINPKILETSVLKTQGIPKRKNKFEGCLSIPNIWGVVKRSASLKLKFLDAAGTEREENFSGFMATIIQHEVDHLSGILFTQRILEQKGKLYRKAKNSQGEDVFEEIHL